MEYPQFESMLDELSLNPSGINFSEESLDFLISKFGKFTTKLIYKDGRTKDALATCSDLPSFKAMKVQSGVPIKLRLLEDHPDWAGGVKAGKEILVQPDGAHEKENYLS